MVSSVYSICQKPWIKFQIFNFEVRLYAPSTVSLSLKFKLYQRKPYDVFMFILRKPGKVTKLKY